MCLPYYHTMRGPGVLVINLIHFVLFSSTIVLLMWYKTCLPSCVVLNPQGNSLIPTTYYFCIHNLNELFCNLHYAFLSKRASNMNVKIGGKHHMILFRGMNNIYQILLFRSLREFEKWSVYDLGALKLASYNEEYFFQYSKSSNKVKVYLKVFYPFWNYTSTWSSY